MSIIFRQYRNDKRFGDDYHKVCDFLIRINEDRVIKPNFLWARWVWMISRPVDNEEQRNLIGIWEDDGKMVALATFELTFGEVHICIDDNYRYLFPQVIEYAEQNLSDKGQLVICLSNTDRDFQRAAIKSGYVPTQEKEPVAVLEIDNEINFSLPENFHLVSMDQKWDFSQYNRVMWRGFGHEGEPSQEEEDIDWRKTMLSSPHLLPELVIAVAEPDGKYISHCGLWYVPGTHYAYVEPVATDPSYRKMGLGKAAVLEAVSRAGRLGAKEAYVCSEQQFYYNLGFYPISGETWWFKKLCPETWKLITGTKKDITG